MEQAMPPMFGASIETIVGAVRSKLIVLNLWDGLVAKHGEQAVDEALQQTGEIHQGVQEIGSSDVNHMVHGTLRALGEPGLWSKI